MKSISAWNLLEWGVNTKNRKVRRKGTEIPCNLHGDKQLTNRAQSGTMGTPSVNRPRYFSIDPQKLKHHSFYQCKLIVSHWQSYMLCSSLIYQAMMKAFREADTQHYATHFCLLNFTWNDEAAACFAFWWQTRVTPWHRWGKEVIVPNSVNLGLWQYV